MPLTTVLRLQPLLFSDLSLFANGDHVYVLSEYAIRILPSPLSRTFP
jgi:hypothetical protein